MDNFEEQYLQSSRSRAAQLVISMTVDLLESILQNHGFDETPAQHNLQLHPPRTGYRSHGRPNTGRPTTGRPRTGVSTNISSQEVICAVSESRGMSPTVGLAFVNLYTCEAVLCQIADSQTYVRTIHKLMVFQPTYILITTSAAQPKSKLFSIIEENMADLSCSIILLDRKYWAENTGLEYIHQLALREDVEAIKISISGNYYAVCCIAAVLRYIELGIKKIFAPHSLRIKYEPSEGSMMIDVSTIRSLELAQNLQNHKSPDCLFGLLSETQTLMGSRLLRSNVLQPLTSPDTLNLRYDALEELTTKEEMFFNTREALKAFLDVDRILTGLIIMPAKQAIQVVEEAANKVIMLKQFVISVQPLFEALAGARSVMLANIRDLCDPENIEPTLQIINNVINEDTVYAKSPLELMNQRTYAVKSGVNGFLDVARQTYKESQDDAFTHIKELAELHNLALDIKFENARVFYIQMPASELEDRALPNDFIHVVRKKNFIECQTLELKKLNQKVIDAHHEVLLLSDQAVHKLIAQILIHISSLFKICEGIAMLDMLCAFAHLVTTQDYVRPHLTDTLGIKAGRHPIREKVQSVKYIPNDVYATQQSRFQIITGCNMSGKSTYIRSIALMQVMAQIGCYVPAQYASFTIIRQLFARVSTDDSIEANVSTFAAEMRETAFILRNVDKHSLVIIDELGRGTSNRDGLAIAIAIAEALINSRALVWFVTHFRDLAKVLGERNGVVSLHLAVDTSEENKMTMLYKIAEGAVQEAHYGLKLASVLPLPLDVLTCAQQVADQLDEQHSRRKKTSLGIFKERRRKLILGLKEHLLQARTGALQGYELAHFLRRLQQEFVQQMTAIDKELAEASGDATTSDEQGTFTATDEQETSTAYETQSESDPTTAEPLEESGMETEDNQEHSNEGSFLQYSPPDLSSSAESRYFTNIERPADAGGEHSALSSTSKYFLTTDQNFPSAEDLLGSDLDMDMETESAADQGETGSEMLY